MNESRFQKPKGMKGARSGYKEALGSGSRLGGGQSI